MTLTTDQILDLYRSGSYGTPDAPVRSSSVKATFWLVYFGHRTAAEYKKKHPLRSSASWCNCKENSTMKMSYFYYDQRDLQNEQGFEPNEDERICLACSVAGCECDAVISGCESDQN
jgi:hypothetical protein